MLDSQINPDDYISFDFDKAVSTLQKQEKQLLRTIIYFSRRNAFLMEKLHRIQIAMTHLAKTVEENEEHVHNPSFDKFYQHLVRTLRDDMEAFKKENEILKVCVESDLEYAQDKLISTVGE